MKKINFLLSGAIALSAFLSTAQAEEFAFNDEMMKAMERDMGITKADMPQYMQAEKFALNVEETAKAQFGEDFAGAWMEQVGKNQYRHVVATTNASLKAIAGTELKHVRYSLKELDDTMALLNESFVKVYESAEFAEKITHGKPQDIQSMYVDVMTNSIVIKVAPEGLNSGINFAASTKADVDMIRIETADGTAMPLVSVIGGIEYVSGGGFCSIGFPVTAGSRKGFATAGHCGGRGTSVRIAGTTVGSVQRANFPGDDMAWANVRSNDTLYPYVSWNNGGTRLDYRIRGSNVAAIGAFVCRTGRTTGARCGRITSRNASANYGTGPVFGLTQSTACAGRGDSGGSWVASGGQAQGVTSGGILPGGNDNCSQSTPTTWFQPVNEILSRYGLRLQR